MEITQAINILYENEDEQISTIYDSKPEVATALNTLIQGFEYPSHSHKTIKAVLLGYFLKASKEVDLGRTLCHHALMGHCEEKGIDLMQFFYNHSQGNWGILTDDDQIANYVALHTKQGRLLSKYKIAGGKPIYLITDFESEEQERMTTAMFISDY